MRNIDDVEYCPACNTSSIRTIAKSQSFYGANDWDTRHYSQALGRVVRSNKEEQRIARERGLVEVGNEDVEKIHKKFNTERDKKIESRYDDIINTKIEVNSR